ncbi:leucine-rich repeat-containing protein 20-like [Sinocyclocheilus rhinocerous]|uniref:leucine-rich repeat-containing protein 20-like n=1 Tax=Sinocyclocheilus rhinocerous TaxID=307959 RepID=UPI0007B9CCB0|nr:PREDICTED: leucine-rich repeat-containing protein 20-like [Sinocyclocheilus rhinocerous]
METIKREPNRMAQAVANVARRINATMEEQRDSLGAEISINSLSIDVWFVRLNIYIDGFVEVGFSRFAVEVDLQGNVLTTLPEAVGNMQHLISIDLSRNKLRVFPERLTDVSSLQHISVEGNQITELPMEKLSLMPALKSVDVRSNPLTPEAASFPHLFTLLT